MERATLKTGLGVDTTVPMSLRCNETGQGRQSGAFFFHLFIGDDLSVRSYGIKSTGMQITCNQGYPAHWRDVLTGL